MALIPGNPAFVPARLEGRSTPQNLYHDFRPYLPRNSAYPGVSLENMVHFVPCKALINGRKIGKRQTVCQSVRIPTHRDRSFQTIVTTDYDAW